MPPTKSLWCVYVRSFLSGALCIHIYTCLPLSARVWDICVKMIHFNICAIHHEITDHLRVWVSTGAHYVSCVSIWFTSVPLYIGLCSISVEQQSHPSGANIAFQS